MVSVVLEVCAGDTMAEFRLRERVLLSKLKAGLFRLSRNHYSNHRWYGCYKERQLQRVLQAPFPGELPHGYGRWLDERMVEYPWMLSRLPENAVNLLDAGSTLNHHFILNHAALRGKNISIITLAPEEQCFWQKRISYVYGDLRSTCFRDGYFDVIVCLSVLEHVGLDNTRYDSGSDASLRNPQAYLEVIREFRRVLKRGGVCLITVPYGKYQIRHWLQVFDSPMITGIMNAFSPSKYDIFYFSYHHDDGWQRSSSDKAAEATYFDLNADTPWPGCPAGAGAICCLEMKK